MLLKNFWLAVYDDPASGAGDDPASGAGDPNPTPTPPATPPKDEKKFTQADLNKFLAEDRKKHEKRVADTVSQLEALKKAKGLSDQEKENLQTQIDDLKNSLLTKEEQAKREKEKLEKTWATEKETLAKERDTWRFNFAAEAITNAITTASLKHKAISAEQVQAILKDHTRITEVLDANGKPTGRFMPKVKFADKDKDGNPIELDLTIEESVKRMKELPERFGNLFESDTPGGLGGSGNRNGFGGASDANNPPTDPVQYREWRKRNLKGKV